MKKFLLTVIICLIFVFNSLTKVSAHLAGQPPFFKVNDVLSAYYPVPLKSVEQFNLPQDIAPAAYLVNENINFEIDTNAMVFPKEIIVKANFSWDFGDGSGASGLANSHAYKKPGSYFLTIYATFQQGSPPQMIQSMLINILPTKDYQLPKSVIIIDNWQSKDPLTDYLESDFSKEFNLDATKSVSSGKIVEYYWDLGDGNFSTEPKLKHKYITDPYTTFPVLRVKDEFGFISDSFVQIKESESAPISESGTNKFPLILIAVVCIVVGGGYFLWRRRNNNQ